MSNYIEKTNGPRAEIRDMGREFLRPNEVARKLGISREAVMRHLRSKRLPGLKLGKMWLVRASELERFLSLRETLFEN